MDTSTQNAVISIMKDSTISDAEILDMFVEEQ